MWTQGQGGLSILQTEKRGGKSRLLMTGGFEISSRLAFRGLNKFILPYIQRSNLAIKRRKNISSVAETTFFIRRYSYRVKKCFFLDI